MENQHRHIAGYRELTENEVATMNECKALAAQVGQLIEQVQALPDVDQRCAAIARTEAQTAFMWLIRAIARPTTFG